MLDIIDLKQNNCLARASPEWINKWMFKDYLHNSVTKSKKYSDLHWAGLFKGGLNLSKIYSNRQVLF